MGWCGCVFTETFGALDECKSSREQRDLRLELFRITGVCSTCQRISASHSTLYRLVFKAQEVSFVIGCSGRRDLCSLIKISSKSRGKQIEWIPQSPTLCSATWMWRVAPTSPPPLSSLFLSVSLALSVCPSASFISHFQLVLILPPSLLTISRCLQWIFKPTFSHDIKNRLPGLFRGNNDGGKLH